MSAADARELIRQLEQDYPPHNFNGKPATYIYGLLDPETIECRYIGQSIRPAERYANHMNEISNCHRSHWLQSLKKRGLFPIMVVFERVEGEWPWQEAERYWIARGRALGWPLTNNTSGGDGIRDLAPEARARISAASRGRRHSPEAIEKLKIARRNRVTSAETRAKMSRSQRGRKITWTDRIAESLRKLGDDDVATIGRRLAAGEKNCDLSKEYGVHRTTISKIKMGTYLTQKRGKKVEVPSWLM